MKRYDAVNTDGDPLYAPSPDGEVVFYSDVAAMVAMNAELANSIAKYKESKVTRNMFEMFEALEKAKELSHE